MNRAKRINESCNRQNNGSSGSSVLSRGPTLDTEEPLTARADSELIQEDADGRSLATIGSYLGQLVENFVSVALTEMNESRVWFIAQKPDLAILDVLPAE